MSSFSVIPNENADLIKRVIGLPGDTVGVRNGQLILNARTGAVQTLDGRETAPAGITKNAFIDDEDR